MLNNECPEYTKFVQFKCNFFVAKNFYSWNLNVPKIQVEFLNHI